MYDRPKLVVLEGTGTGKVYALDAKESHTLGRGQLADIPVLDIKCSRKHAIVERRDDGYYLVDLGSTNGTKLNGTKVPKKSTHKLKPGDTLRLGHVVLEFQAVVAQERPKLTADGPPPQGTFTVDPFELDFDFDAPEAPAAAGDAQDAQGLRDFAFDTAPAGPTAPAPPPPPPPPGGSAPSPDVPAFDVGGPGGSGPTAPAPPPPPAAPAAADPGAVDRTFVFDDQPAFLSPGSQGAPPLPAPGAPAAPGGFAPSSEASAPSELDGTIKLNGLPDLSGDDDDEAEPPGRTIMLDEPPDFGDLKSEPPVVEDVAPVESPGSTMMLDEPPDFGNLAEEEEEEPQIDRTIMLDGPPQFAPFAPDEAAAAPAPAAPPPAAVPPTPVLEEEPSFDRTIMFDEVDFGADPPSPAAPAPAAPAPAAPAPAAPPAEEPNFDRTIMFDEPDFSLDTPAAGTPAPPTAPAPPPVDQAAFDRTFMFDEPDFGSVGATADEEPDEDEDEEPQFDKTIMFDEPDFD
jgi:pSer/pThr/pTyr-binding forkhead associated (FHA) protein